MNRRAQSLEAFLDRSFARFRALPSDGVDSACYRVLQRLRMTQDRMTEVVEFTPQAARRYGRLVILIAATVTATVFAQQLATRRAVQVAPVKEEPVRVVQQATPATPEPPKPPPPSRGKLEFTATSLRVLPPGTKMGGVGLACHGSDGVQRIVTVIMPGVQDGVKAPLGRCMGSGIFLSTLIEFAYGVAPRQISGGPDWSRTIGSFLTLGSRGAITSLGVDARDGQFSWWRSESFQIEATADDPAHSTLADLREMLRNMLADRFKLRFHREQKQVPGYSIAVAEGGSKMKAVSGEYVESLLVNQGRSTLDKLARTLGIFLGGPVIDKTGLLGAYEYAIEVSPPPAPQVAPNVRGGAASSEDVFKYVNSQMEEKLGLRLQIEKVVTVDAMMIDSVEPPTPN
jgi:uncharacterized protein (TIGR03435 family)